MFVNGGTNAGTGAGFYLQRGAVTTGVFGTTSLWVGGASNANDPAVGALSGLGINFFVNNSTTVAMNLSSGGNLILGADPGGGTLLRAGGSATIGGELFINAATAIAALTSTTGTNACYVQLNNTGGQYYLGVDNSTGTIFASSSAYAMVLYTPFGIAMRIIPTDNSTNFYGKVVLSGSTTGRSGFGLASGTAPTSPVDGDMWYDGTNVKFRVGGTTKQFTLV